MNMCYAMKTISQIEHEHVSRYEVEHKITHWTWTTVMLWTQYHKLVMNMCHAMNTISHIEHEHVSRYEVEHTTH